jgi:2-oxoglutarate ferredoxin oxidoreductase subunit beta
MSEQVDVKSLNTYGVNTWCPGCVLPGTLIHGNPSIKAIERISAGEMVLGSDGAYHKIAEVMGHLHLGPMHRLRIKCFGETVLTEEHPVLIVRRERKKHVNRNLSPEWVEAAQIRPGDYVVYPIPSEVKDIAFIPLSHKRKHKDTRSKALPTRITVNEDFLRFAGYYLAEGCINKRTMTFYFSSKERNLAEDAANLAKSLFWLDGRIVERREKGSIEVHVNSSYLVEILAECFGKGAAQKRIPHEFMLLPVEKQKALIKGLWLGDGYFGKKCAGYKTISLALAEQLKMLLIRQGMVPTVAVNKAYGMHRTSYAIHVVSARDYNKLAAILGSDRRLVKKGGKPPMLITEGYVYLPVRRNEVFHYRGPVYNLEVEGANSYVTSAAALHNCGNFGIERAAKLAFTELINEGRVKRENIVTVFGIGCHGKLADYLNLNSFYSLHGRVLAPATGIKVSNPELTVVGFAGDGDAYSEGLEHIMFAAKRNVDITTIVHDNRVYALTTGQFTPTSPKGFLGRSTPRGAPEEPFNPIELMLVSGATFVARGYVGNVNHLKDLIKQAMLHKGFALVDVLQPCVTFFDTYKYYNSRVYNLQDDKHDKSDWSSALTRAREWNYGGEDAVKIPIGIFYEVDRPTYDETVGGGKKLRDTPTPALRRVLQEEQ